MLDNKNTQHFVEINASKQSVNQRKLLCGKGVNDAWYEVYNNHLKCPYYRKWSDMIIRCYSEKTQIKHPTYKGCSVCSEWLLFSNFKAWMQNQDWQGKELDKDIIVYGNKIYSPENCCFVSKHLNNLLSIKCKKEDDNLPTGVSYEKESGKFKASISKYGKSINLGRYYTPDNASKVYNNAKSNHIIEIANSLADSRIADGLIIHAQMILQEGL